MAVAQCNEQTVRERRTELGLSLRDVARMTGLHPSTVSRYETGHPISPSARRLIAAALDTPERFMAPRRST